MLSAGQYYRHNHRRTVRIPKGGALNASLTALGADKITDGPRKIWRVIKNIGAKFKNYRRIFVTPPME